jgi:hypothetical protein
MWNRWKLPARVLVPIMLAGCSTVSDDIESRLDKVCQFPGSDTPAGEIVRARIALAAVAGYSYRTVDFFSAKGEVNNDVTQALTHIDAALTTINAAADQTGADKDFFPVYQADYRVELVRAAAVGAQPAIRAAKTLGVGVSLSTLGQSKTVLASLLEDQLYVAAYEETCKGLATRGTLTQIAGEATARMAKRCTDLQGLASPPTPAASCASAASAATVTAGAGALAGADAAIH